MGRKKNILIDVPHKRSARRARAAYWLGWGR